MQYRSIFLIASFFVVIVTHPCHPNPCKEDQVCDINRSCYGAILDRCQSHACVPGNYLYTLLSVSSVNGKQCDLMELWDDLISMCVFSVFCSLLVRNM